MKPTSNLILVGPMGAGKSTIGRCLARRLGMDFIDLDHEIERRTGASIGTIFDCEGEAGFRARESAVLADCLQASGRVLATGGGAVLDEGNRTQMRKSGFVVHLQVDLQAQLERLAHDRQRPLLACDDRKATLERLARERTPLYREVSDLDFDTGLGPVAAACTRLAELLERQWRRPQQPEPHPSRGAGAAAAVEVGGAQPYRISIAPGLLSDGASLSAALRGSQALIVSDDTVAPLYADRVEQALRAARPGLSTARFILPAGEASKTLQAFSGAIDALAALGARRDACVYALGGGVVGDLAGFAAACWMRGIDCVQLPTTLLAMVDSSVGGKTAVDLPQGKNLVGAFHPPRAVLADTAVLRTLPPRELRAGLAEVVKYGAIADAGFLAWLEAQADALLSGDADALAEAIARSCAHKAAIVERDPREQGDRALLNFGHTFAHAIEAAQGYDGLNHGEAVAVGMVLAARLSEHMGLAPAADTARLRALLARLGLPVDLPPGLEPGQLLELMRLDKKAVAGGLRFVVWERIGEARVRDSVPEDAVLRILGASGP